MQTDHDDAVLCAAEESCEADEPVQSCYDHNDPDHSCVDQDSDDHEDSELMLCVDEDTDNRVDADHSCVDQDSDDHEDSDLMSCADKKSDECLDSDLHDDDATVPLCVDNDTDAQGDAKQCVSDADSIASSTSTLSFFSTVSSVKCLVFDTPTDWDSEPTMSDSSDHDEPVEVVGGVLHDLIAAVQNVECGQECVSVHVIPDVDVHNADHDSECVTPAVAVSQAAKHVQRIVKRKRSKPQVVPTKSSHRLKKRYNWKWKGPTFVQCTYCSFTSSIIKNVRAHKVEEHKLFVCCFGSCLSDWTVKTARNIHEQVHQASKFVCDTCEVQFDCKSVYKCHLIKHAEMQGFVCSILSCQCKFK